jgi:xanthine/uracil permease
MRLTSPKNVTFWIAVILVVLGVIGKLTSVPILTPYSWWLVFIGFIVLMLGNLLRGF